MEPRRLRLPFLLFLLDSLYFRLQFTVNCIDLAVVGLPQTSSVRKVSAQPLRFLCCFLLLMLGLGLQNLIIVEDSTLYVVLGLLAR